MKSAPRLIGFTLAIIWLFCPILFSSLAFAQSAKGPAGGGSTGSGSLSGTVKDSTGAVLPSAQIVLQPTATTAASNAQGDFSIQNVRPGTYTVTVSAVGFKNSVSTVIVTAGAEQP